MLLPRRAFSLSIPALKTASTVSAKAQRSRSGGSGGGGGSSSSSSLATQPRASKARKRMQQPGEKKTFTVAIEGCCHGELDNIYATLAHLERSEGRKVDLLICCGDFQAVRNLDDLETMSVPLKYRDIMTFYKYYSGEKTAPVPTLFIGGNHEAPNYLWELFYGGWAAPNIYFLGYSGAVRFGGHRIAGLSGTYVAQHFHWGHHERLPYNEGSVKSAYHVRQLHVHRLMQLQQSTSIFLSHDWPNLITRFGDSGRLFQRKPYFKAEALRGDLGSPANQQLLEALQPSYWFSAHLHCKFPAVVPHQPSQPAAAAAAAARKDGSGSTTELQQQQPAGAASSSGTTSGDVPPAAEQAAAAAGAGGAKVTRFLALDKCLPGRDFLQVVELDVAGPLELCYDAEWLAVLRSTHNLMSTQKHGPPLPPDWGGRKGPAAEDVTFVNQLLEQRGSAAIPHNFEQTAPAYDPSQGRRRGTMPTSDLRNPQTIALLELLQLPYNLSPAGSNAAAYASRAAIERVAAAGGGTRYQAATGLLSQQQQQQQRNPEEIDIDSEGDDDTPAAAAPAGASTAAASAAAAATKDEFAISLSDDDDGDDAAAGDGGASAAAGGGAGGGSGEQQQQPGGSLADGAPDSEAEAEDEAALAAFRQQQQRLKEQQQQQSGAEDDEAMFGRVNTAEFPYYTG